MNLPNIKPSHDDDAIVELSFNETKLIIQAIQKANQVEGPGVKVPDDVRALEKKLLGIYKSFQ